MEGRLYSTWSLSALVGLLVAIPASPQCLPDPLGAAGAYSIFSLGELDFAEASFQGRVASADTAVLENVSVGDGVPEPADPIEIVVAGQAIYFTNGIVRHGDVVYATTADLTDVSIPDGEARQAEPIDFAPEAESLVVLSEFLATLEPNGAVDSAESTITLYGDDPELNIFELPSGGLSQADQLVFEIPDGSTVLVNISDTTVSFSNLAVSLQGASPRKIVFNLRDASSVKLTSRGMVGTILAPGAAVEMNLDPDWISFGIGAVIGASVSGYGDFVYAPFEGCLKEPESGDMEPPDITDLTPTPDSFTPSIFPVVSAKFSDADSGVDPSTVTLFFDGVDVTAGAAISAEGMAWAASEAVEEGPHAVELTVADLAGNPTTTDWSFTIDGTPPTLTITEPPEVVTGDPTPSIVLAYDDILSGIDVTTLQVLVDDVDVTSSCTATTSGAICESQPLTDGFHTATVQVADVAGHTAWDTRVVQVLLDIDAPTVTITSPEDGMVTATETVQVTGTVTDDGAIASVRVQGHEVTLTDGAFAHQVTLAEGGNGILATAQDATGKTGSTTVNVIRDVVAPTVEIEAPEPGALVNTSSVVVRGRVMDVFGLAELTVAGEPLAPAVGPFEATVDLTPGPSTLSVVAVDSAGNPGEATVDVEYFVLPQATITSPEDLSTIAATTVDVSGTVDDPAATVTVNGVPATVSGSTFTASAVPLIEGGNTLTATATDAQGHVATASVTVLRDTQPPLATVYSPTDGAIVFTDTITAHGLVNDIVAGTVNSSDVTVTVNGVTAEVENRAFLAEGVPLALGENLLEVVATDAPGNTRTTTLTITREEPSGQRIELVSGSGQSAVIGSTLPQPLVARVVDAAGIPVPGVPVVFSVEGGNGSLQPAGGGETMRKVAIDTDGAGEAAVELTLGTRVGVATQVVVARAVGYQGRAEFLASALPGEPELIVADANGLQVGVPGRLLPRPLVAAVVDTGSNRLAQVPVRFRVVKGGGSFEDGLSEIVVETDADGRAIVPFTLGPEEGTANNAAEAMIDGLAGSPVAGFVASGRAAGDPAQTSISGVVLDNTNLPVPGVTARVRGTSLTAVADTEGYFRIPGAPVGDVDLIIDGSTATRPGSWPDLEYDLVTIPGRDNTVGGPIYLLPLDLENGLLVTETEGGTLTLPDIPGFALEIPAGSVTFPGGGKSGLVSVTVVHSDRVPMTPNFGLQPRLIVTIQPAGALFDPPARLTTPNVDCLDPGQVTEIYSFDHDVGTFVSIGPATTSDDGMVIASNPGVGIVKAGWHYAPPPPPPDGTVEDCGECQSPSGSSCVPAPDGIACDDRNPCTAEDRCTFGSCYGQPVEIQSVTASTEPASGQACTGEETQFRAHVEAQHCDTFEYMWEFGDGGTSTEKDPLYIYSEPGEYIAKVRATCAECVQAQKEDSLDVTAVEAREVEIIHMAFIPPNHILGPPDAQCPVEIPGPGGGEVSLRPQVYSGDDRGHSRDASMFRARTAITVIPLRACDPDGIKDGTESVDVGLTRRYAFDALDDGVVDAADNDDVYGDCHLLHAEGFASTAAMGMFAYWLDDQTLSVGFQGGTGNPLTPSPDINWNLTIDIDGKDETWALSGRHDCYPGHELYVGDSAAPIQYTPPSSDLGTVLACLSGLFQRTYSSEGGY